MSNILILSPFFFPEEISTGKYNTYLASALINEGHNVDVMCSHPLYPRWKPIKSERNINGIKAIRGGAWVKYPKNQLLRRLILELWFLSFVLFNYVYKRNKYDLIIPILPPSLFMVAISVLKPKRTIVVGVVHDLQGVYAKYKKNKIRRIIFSAIAFIERHVFNSCDKLIFLSNDMKKLAVEKYSLDIEKTTVHYPFITIDHFIDKGRLSNIIEDNEIALVYSGALGEKQAPDKLVMLFENMLNSDEDINGYIFSEGPIFDELKNKHAHSRLRFHNLVSEEDLPELLLRSSVQIIPQESGTSDGSLPSKLPNLIAAGVKIFCITDEGSELEKIVNKYSKGVVTTSWDMNSLISKTREIIDLDVGEYACNDEELLHDFARSGLVKKIITQSKVG